MMKPILATLAALAALTGAATAQEARGLGAHEHGHGRLNIAIEGERIMIALEAPGADIVGFEHRAETADDRTRIEDALATLSRPLSLFVIPGEAGCSVVETGAGLVVGAEHDHMEFEAEYVLVCTNPGAVDRVDLAFFETFPNSEELGIRVISDSGTQSVEVTRSDPRLDLAGRS